MCPEYLDLMLRRLPKAATIFVVLIGTPGFVYPQAAQKPVTPAQISSPKKTVTPAESKPAKRSKKAREQQTTVVVPPPPPPPPTPEQMPSVAPEVAYQGGMLTIKAPNSTMNDVLSAVRRVTGATIEKPPVGGNDRVVAQLGPGQPKDVLESLLQGSRYDYIILGSMTKPGGVDRIILTARANAGSSTAVAANAPGAAQPGRPNVQPAQPNDQPEEPETDQEDMTVPERDQAEPDQPQPEQQQQQQQPGNVPQGMPIQPPQEQTQQGQTPDQNQQPRVKSPDELLRELQQMQKQPPDQNQQQQEQPPPQ